jgi:hypothetical protein
MSAPAFWSTPLRYLRWASYEKPAIFYSIVVGSFGPVALVTLPPIRRYFGDVDPEPIPLTYPGKRNLLLEGRQWKCLYSGTIDMLILYREIVPGGPRVIPKGFDDE